MAADYMPGAAGTSKLDRIAYIVLTAISLWSIYGNEDMRLKVASVIIIAIAFWMFLQRDEFPAFSKTMLSFTIRYLAFVVLIIVLASITYLVNTEGVDIISRGYQKLMFQFVIVLVVLAAVYLFGRDSIEYTFWGTVLFGFAAILYSFKLTGFAQAASDIQYFLTSGGDAVGYMKYLELHDSTFSFGFFLIYFVLFMPKSRRRTVCIVVASFFFLIGFKRIGILALIFALLVGVVIRRFDAKQTHRIAMVVGIVFFGVGFLYIVAVRYGVFDWVMNQMGIDTMGREDLYTFIQPYYDISPTFFGQGYEFITVLFRTASYSTLNIQKIGALHNGFLTQFIEFGFWGFWLWEGFWLIYMTWFTKRFGKEVQLLYLICTIYAFTTYFTDNTAFYFFTGIAYRLVPMAYACGRSRMEEAHEDSDG